MSFASSTTARSPFGSFIVACAEYTLPLPPSRSRAGSCHLRSLCPLPTTLRASPCAPGALLRSAPRSPICRPHRRAQAPWRGRSPPPRRGRAPPPRRVSSRIVPPHVLSRTYGPHRRHSGPRTHPKLSGLCPTVPRPSNSSPVRPPKKALGKLGLSCFRATGSDRFAHGPLVSWNHADVDSANAGVIALVRAGSQPGQGMHSGACYPSAATNSSTLMPASRIRRRNSPDFSSL